MRPAGVAIGNTGYCLVSVSPEIVPLSVLDVGGPSVTSPDEGLGESTPHQSAWRDRRLGHRPDQRELPRFLSPFSNHRTDALGCSHAEALTTAGGSLSETESSRDDSASWPLNVFASDEDAAAQW